MSQGLSPIPPSRRTSNIVIPQNRPVYRIKEGKFFGPDDCLHNEDEIIAYDGEPNFEMEPLNEMADEKMREFLGKLDAEGKKVAEKTGKAYTSLADAFENARVLETQESKKVQVLTAKELTPLMGAKKKAGLVAKIEEEQNAPLMGAVKSLIQSNAAEKNIGKAAVNKSPDVTKNADI